MFGTTVAYKPFHNQLAKRSFKDFMRAVLDRVLQQWVVGVLQPTAQGPLGDGRLTQANHPPGNPGRFIDELARRRGHRYLTLVYQIDRHCKRLLWIGRERKAETLHGFFDELGAARSAALRFVCSDLWKPYLKGVAEQGNRI